MPRLQAQNWDIDLLRSLHGSNPGMKNLSLFADKSTIPVSLAVPAIIGGVGLINNDENLLKDAIYIGVASGISLGFTHALKNSFKRNRPYVSFPDLSPDTYESSYSFPSGHTSAAFATATALSLKYRKWYVIAPGFAWAGYVGYSRMHLGVHYPSDVLAGALLGTGSAWLTWKLNSWLNNKGVLN